MSEIPTVYTQWGSRLDTIGELIQSVDSFKGFMTGSAAIGGFSRDSDVDIAFSIVYNEGVQRALATKANELGFDIRASDYNRGYKLRRAGAVILNVIVLHPYDYCAWLFATNILAAQYPIINKHNRHRAFELAITLFKLANASTEYLTTSGAEIYYNTHHTESLMSEFTRFMTRQSNIDLPF